MEITRFRQFHGQIHPNNKLSGQVLPRDEILMTSLELLNSQQKSQKFFSKLIAWSSKLQSGSGCIANLRLQVHATDKDHEESKLDIFEAQFSKNDTMTHPDSLLSALSLKLKKNVPVFCTSRLIPAKWDSRWRRKLHIRSRHFAPMLFRQIVVLSLLLFEHRMNRLFPVLLAVARRRGWRCFDARTRFGGVQTRHSG